MVVELGDRGYCFGKLWKYWSDKCTNGQITESQMEDKIDRYEQGSMTYLKKECRRLRISILVQDRG